MLTPPDLSTGAISARVGDVYGLTIRQVTFLPLGADVNAAVYRLDAHDGAAYFLKLRRGDFDEVGVDVPAFLRAQGIQQVMAPLATRSSGLWTVAHGFTWILYPFMEGDNGYHVALPLAQWKTFGACLRAIHATELPAELRQRVPREDYSTRWRDMTEAFGQQLDSYVRGGDPIAARLAAFWLTRRAEIASMVERANELASSLRRRTPTFVLCHADLHPGNLLIDVNGQFAIVDWDNPIYAPKERDLMLTGGGVSDAWSDPREEALLYGGYGPAEVDMQALAYYRYERIIADLATFGEQIFGAQGSVEDREQSIEWFTGQFQPNEVVEVAHRTYERLL